jgi:hypothetical protein
MNNSEFTVKALKLLACGSITATQFALEMWSDSNKEKNRLNWAARQHLARLRKLGLVVRNRIYGHVDTFSISQEGKLELEKEMSDD